MPKWMTEAQERLIKELAEETGTRIFEMPKTQDQASKKIDHLLRTKKNPRTNLWKGEMKRGHDVR